MSQQRPFEISRWESLKAPTPEFLAQMLEREGYEMETIEVPAGTHTPEFIFDDAVVRVLMTGHIQYSFPGYGVIELNPGDMLRIEPGVRHDAIVSSEEAATLLRAFGKASL